MDYSGFVPAPPLDAYIDDLFLLFGSSGHARMVVPPMPSAQLLINLGDPITVRDPFSDTPSAVCIEAGVIGVSTTRTIVEYPSSVAVVGVHFKPWGLSPFFDVAADEFRDRFVSLEDLWGVEAVRLRERVGGASSAVQMVRVVEDTLRQSMCGSPSSGFELVQGTAGLLAHTWGGTSVRELAHAAGVSGNHLAAQFKRHVGVTPKRMARIYRFARLVLAVDVEDSVDWPAMAQLAGYFDQPHLSKEFKDFTGHTPSEYLTIARTSAAATFPVGPGPLPAE